MVYGDTFKRETFTFIAPCQKIFSLNIPDSKLGLEGKVKLGTVLCEILYIR